MTTSTAIDHEAGSDSAQSLNPWALGNYHRFATETIWGLGRILITNSRIHAGTQVLDVAAGTGNAAIRAALHGAAVTALDCTPKQLTIGRRQAELVGADVNWQLGDAEHMPFADDQFDVVLSCLGIIFAPSHQLVARELVRVCKPGGQIALLNFTPGDLADSFFALVAKYLPESPDPSSNPLDWGREPYLEALFGSAIEELQLVRRTLVERAASPEAYCDFYLQNFGPMVAIRQSLDNDGRRLNAFKTEFLELARKHNRGKNGAAAEYPFDYVIATATVADHFDKTQYC